MPTNDNANRRELPNGHYLEKKFETWYLMGINGQEITALEFDDYDAEMFAKNMHAAPAGDIVRGPYAFITDLLASGALDGERSKFYRELAQEVLAQQPSTAPDAPKDVRECDCMGEPSFGDGTFERNLRRKCPVHGDTEAEQKQRDFMERRLKGRPYSSYSLPNAAPVTPQRSAEVELPTVAIVKLKGYLAEQAALEGKNAHHYHAACDHIRQLEAAVPQGDDAWTQGAEAMREAAAIAAERGADEYRYIRADDSSGTIRVNRYKIGGHTRSAKAIRALPIPPRPGKDTPDEKGGAE